jgi:hypothetical protein
MLRSCRVTIHDSFSEPVNAEFDVVRSSDSESGNDSSDSSTPATLAQSVLSARALIVVQIDMSF